MIAFVLLFLITLFVAYANGAPTPANRARHEHSPLVHASAITSRTFIDASRWRVSR